jgi:hypothetical protein
MLRIAVLLAVTLVAGCMLGQGSGEPRQFLVFFETNDAALTPTAQQVIATVATAAQTEHPSRITVAGRADGGTAHDATLADERASVVVRALVDAGVDPHAIAKEPSAPPKGDKGVAAHLVVVEFPH